MDTINTNSHQDEQFMREFFDKSRTEMADDGFTHQVMHRIGYDSVQRNHQPVLLIIWKKLCIALAIGLFCFLNGFSLLWNALISTFHSIDLMAFTSISPVSYAVIMLILLTLLLKKLSSLI
jgi:hypothetical protein